MDPILLVFGYFWLKNRTTKKAATGPSVEARSGRGHFAPQSVPPPQQAPATGPSVEARRGRAHF